MRFQIQPMCQMKKVNVYFLWIARYGNFDCRIINGGQKKEFFFSIPIIIILELFGNFFRKVTSKNFEMIFWKLSFSNFSKVNMKLKTNFVSKLHVILAVLWSIDHTFQVNICWDRRFPLKDSIFKIFFEKLW